MCVSQNAKHCLIALHLPLSNSNSIKFTIAESEDLAKVCLIIIVSNSGANNSASRHDSLNLKGSAESGEKND